MRRTQFRCGRTVRRQRSAYGVGGSPTGRPTAQHYVAPRTERLGVLQLKLRALLEECCDFLQLLQAILGEPLDTVEVVLRMQRGARPSASRRAGTRRNGQRPARRTTRRSEKRSAISPPLAQAHGPRADRGCCVRTTVRLPGRTRKSKRRSQVRQDVPARRASVRPIVHVARCVGAVVRLAGRRRVARDTVDRSRLCARVRTERARVRPGVRQCATHTPRMRGYMCMRAPARAARGHHPSHRRRHRPPAPLFASIAIPIIVFAINAVHHHPRHHRSDRQFNALATAAVTAVSTGPCTPGRLSASDGPRAVGLGALGHRTGAAVKSRIEMIAFTAAKATTMRQAPRGAAPGHATGADAMGRECPQCRKSKLARWSHTGDGSRSDRGTGCRMR